VEIDPSLTRELRHFVRRRARGGRPPHVDAGFGLRLQFAEPVRGPLLLGYAAHYGLGLFEACAS
jgi:CRISPR-associated protein Csb2